MVFTRTVRVGRYPSPPARTFPVHRPDPGDPADIQKEREKLALLVAYENDLEVLRDEIEAYYAGKTDLEDVLAVMMSSMICHHISKLKTY
jgi:hypothetical protein